MRVAIDLLISEKEPGGTLYSARALLEGLAAIDRTNEYIIITGHPEEYEALAATAPGIRIYPAPLQSWRGILIKHQLVMPKILRQIRPDLLHVPSFAAPLGWRGPLVLTIHDLAFLKVPEQSSLYVQIYWRFILRQSVRRARRIIAVSEQARDELIKIWSVKPERIHLIHNALRSSLSSKIPAPEEVQAIRKRYGIGDRYLLHIGRIMPRKNVETLVAAFDLLAPRFTDLHLVLTGGTGYGGAGVVQQIEASPHRQRIHQVGWVPDQDLAGLYTGASALIVPSKHEGFGLPALEAMANGTVVVASPEAASIEIAGEAVLRADCSRASSLADAIAQVLSDEVLRERLIRLGRTQILPFTSDSCAAATIHTYQDALNIDSASETGIPSNTPDSERHPSCEEEHPSVSVIIPAARSDLVSRALGTLCQQGYAGKVEVVVVGPAADTLAQRWPIIPVKKDPMVYPGAARNLGVAYSTGEVLLFLDDDCLVADDWVERNVQALKQPGIGAVGGRLRGKSRAFFSRCADFANLGEFQHGHVIDVPLAGGSIGIPRTLFEAVGGFDGAKRYGEDTEFSYRIRAKGFRTIYQPAIQVIHDHSRNTLGKLLHYNYVSGRKTGLGMKIQHRDIGLRNRLLYAVRSPLIFLLLLPLIALASTMRIVYLNIRHNQDVLLYAPFILLAKLAYEFGIFRNITLASAPAQVERVS